MPFFRFIVHGYDPAVPDRGFWTSRHAYGTTIEAASDRVLTRLRKEFEGNASEFLGDTGALEFETDRAWRISLLEALRTPNTGSSFYDEGEADEPEAG